MCSTYQRAGKGLAGIFHLVDLSAAGALNPGEKEQAESFVDSNWGTSLDLGQGWESCTCLVTGMGSRTCSQVTEMEK